MVCTAADDTTLRPSTSSYSGRPLLPLHTIALPRLISRKHIEKNVRYTHIDWYSQAQATVPSYSTS